MVMDRLFKNLFHRAAPSVVPMLMGGAILVATTAPAWSQVTTGLLDQDVEQSTSEIGLSEPWWEPQVGQAISRSSQSRPITLDQLLVTALQHSNQIKVFSDIPLIRETAILESQGRFDWHAFAESSIESANHPVGSSLDTGLPGVDRLVQDEWNSSVGLRKQTTTGGTVELRQRVGTLDNNSRFLVPRNQGNSRISLNFTQPLLNGAGRPYNTSLIMLSEIDANIGQDEFARQLQSHLLEISRAYWTLHLERALLLQKQNLYRQGLLVQKSLKAREDLDVVRSQTVLVDAAIAERKSDLIRAAAAVRNSEARIRALVNDPSMTEVGIEFIPLDIPTQDYFSFDLADVQTTAIAQRPEIQQNIKQIHAAGIRLNMSKNELLPQLNALFGIYAEGLQGEFDISNALADQYTNGRPSATAGLQFDIPIGNRQARGRYNRREIELRQMQNQLATTMATLSLEAEVAVREVETSYAEMTLRHQSMNSAVERVQSIESRWEILPGEDQSGPLFLNTLLDAQSKATKAESDFASSKLTYSLALMNLKKAMGTLLKHEMISELRTHDGVIPQIILDKQSRDIQAEEVQPLEVEPETVQE